MCVSWCILTQIEHGSADQSNQANGEAIRSTTVRLSSNDASNGADDDGISFHRVPLVSKLLLLLLCV